MVVENIHSCPDFLLPAPFKHTVFLTTAMADLPAQNKMSKNMSWSSALSCAHCTLNGQMGYRQPVPYGKLCHGHLKYMQAMPSCKQSIAMLAFCSCTVLTCLCRCLGLQFERAAHADTG